MKNITSQREEWEPTEGGLLEQLGLICRCDLDCPNFLHLRFSFHSFTNLGLDSLRVYDSFWFKQMGCRRGRDEAIREEEGEGEGNLEVVDKGREEGHNGGGEG